mmetsp:Transcript_91510/g.197883  ORF Transcript_91510/g.197883 Transcript_91510/m.197883 type:complete len:99 (+) Transcript_91510:613-909(+)
MNMPFTSMFVYSNEKLRHKYKEHFKTIHMQAYFALAGLSTVIAVAVTQPFDLIKTKLQTQNFLKLQEVNPCGTCETHIDKLMHVDEDILKHKELMKLK